MLSTNSTIKDKSRKKIFADKQNFDIFTTPKVQRNRN
jgi:hypothetical protein